jgi:DNA-binding CsgD family transcriptional regulator
MKLSIFKESRNIWETATKGSKTDNDLQFELDIQKKLLNIFQVGDWYYLVFNLPASQLDLVSPSIEQVLGTAPENVNLDYLLGIIHPEDMPFFLNFEHFIVRFFDKLPVDKILNYKVRYDYRVRKTDGTYIRVLQQTVTLEHDEKGALLRTFIVYTDISLLKKEGKPILSLIGLEGEPSYIDIDVEKIYQPSSFLSNREREIIVMMIDGKVTKEIAHILGISKLTVDTYRKNLLQKTGTRTSSELVAKAIREGWV